MKQAVASLIERDGLYLAVSRRNDPNAWGIPGGKVDAFEDAMTAIIREVAEEIGISSSPTSWTPVFIGGCSGEVDYWVTAFVWEESPIQDTELVLEDGLTFTWLTRDQLCDPRISPFSDYNVSTFNALDNMRDFQQRSQYGNA